ncbi:hypothetical protein [Psychromonas antarctica]|uniref:hypothetical protein n=1 Tax=Psychromonas antarctica TaxID=67573 RepID=UPI001EE88DF6|nr:hypothetical protein [Psychromonas antarctica]MCG6202318.1 hypothetical protein [Psychromonas antarctica]
MPTNTSKTRKDELAASKEAALEAYDKLLEAKDHFKLAAEAAGVDLTAEATEQLLKGRAKTEKLGEQASTFMREKPLSTLGIAVITGFVLSQLFSRK